MWSGWSSLFSGIRLIISGLTANLLGPVNMVNFGIISILLGFFFLSGWEGAVIGVLGICLVASGLISGLVDSSNFLIIGIIMAMISLIRIYHQNYEVERAHKTV